MSKPTRAKKLIERDNLIRYKILRTGVIEAFGKDRYSRVVSVKTSIEFQVGYEIIHQVSKIHLQDYEPKKWEVNDRKQQDKS